MKSELDKEIDRWLRGHTEATRRRGGASASTSDAGGNGGSGGSGDSGHDAATPDTSAAHLDADELSAYAENALPAQTRLRYASHLADCDHCRKIATNIALASGVAGEIEKREAATTNARAAHTPKTSWSEWLAALFSPRALRYVAPVLAVMLVGIVAFVVLRQNAGEKSLARRYETLAPNTQTANDTTVRETTGTTGNADTATTNMNSNASALPPSAGIVGDQPQPKSEDAPASNEIAGSTSAPIVADKATGNVINKEADTNAPLAMKAGPPEKKADDDANFAVQTAPPAPAQSVEKERAVELEESARVYAGAANAQQQQNNRANTYGVGRKRSGGGGEDQMAQSNRGYEVQQRGEQQRELARDERRMKDEQRTEERSRAGAMKSAPAEPRTSARRDEVARSTTAAVAETRSVGGRSFRFQNGAWTDTAYRAGQATTNISRGSERFRALAADEPGLARIASNLDGTVIVVWKNRIYRIR
ncbi:MAG TPA: zf-HC2 domain-containing protein [Pyrinomonadaceae bacterium]|jgi:hypothetical protein|nr:zf-HC2 domain-containing protein [Pyrinomonadaceae bacterium]